MYNNILNKTKKNIPLKLSQELYDYVDKKDDNFYMETFYYKSGKILSELNDQNTISKKGGIIIFPAPKNNIEMNKSEFSQYLVKKFEFITKYLFDQRNIDFILQNNDEIIGCTIGNCFNGRYHSKNGQLYSNESITIQLTNLDFSDLTAIAEQLCLIMKLESILIKDNSQFNMVYLEAKDIKLKDNINK